MQYYSVDITAQGDGLSALQWKVAAMLPQGNAQGLGIAGPVAGVHHSVIMIAGGANFPDAMPWLGGKKKYYDGIYVFYPDSGEWLLQGEHFRLPVPLAYAASCSVPQGLFYAGGENEQGITDKCWLLQWDTIAKKIICKGLPRLPLPLTNAAATAKGNTVYLAGGETADAVSNHFYELDIDNPGRGWKSLAAIPQPVSHAVMVLTDEGSVFLIGGRKKNPNGISDCYSDVFRFDIQKNHWEAQHPLPYALSAGTGIAVPSKGILLFGGDKGETFHETEKLLAAIRAESNPEKKALLVSRKNALQAAHPGFSKTILSYHFSTGQWTAGDSISYAAPVTTTAIAWKDCVFLPSGEIRAGVRTPQVLSATIYQKNN